MSDSEFYCEHLFAGLRGASTWLARGEDWEETVELEHIEVDEFELPTGKLSACDENYGFRFEGQDSVDYIKTFVDHFTPGRYRFQLCIARYQPSDPRQYPQFEDYPPELLDTLFPPNQPPTRDERTALAIIRKGESDIVRWELAKLQAESSLDESNEQELQLPISAGVVAYLDSSVVDSLRTFGRNDPARIKEMRGEIDARFNANNRNTRSWATFATEGNSVSNIVVCSTGMGSGGFPSYWGFDATGIRSCFVTDFHCLYCLDI